MKRSEPPTTVTVDEPALADDERRAARLAWLAERLRSPDGLDRDALAREQLPGDE